MDHGAHQGENAEARLVDPAQHTHCGRAQCSHREIDHSARKKEEYDARRRDGKDADQIPGNKPEERGQDQPPGIDEIGERPQYDDGDSICDKERTDKPRAVGGANTKNFDEGYLVDKSVGQMKSEEELAH